MSRDEVAPAATLILLRPATLGFEVLLLLRATSLKFAGGIWVFPGGRVDNDDTGDGDAYSIAAARQAAVRELSEEAGIQVQDSQLQPWSHWTTPAGQSRRFATWFLTAVAPTNSQVVIDDGEIVAYQWLTPQAAIELHRRHLLPLLPPTLITLLELSRLDSPNAALAFVQHREAPHYRPKWLTDGDQVASVYEEDCAYTSESLESNGHKHRSVRRSNIWYYLNDDPAAPGEELS